MWDFESQNQFYTLSTKIVDNVSNAGTAILPGANTNTAIGFFVVPRDGYLTRAELYTEDTLAANDTNF